MVDDAKPTFRNDAKQHGTGEHRFGDRRVPSSLCSLRSLPTHGSVHARINDMSANCWPMVIISSGGMRAHLRINAQAAAQFSKAEPVQLSRSTSPFPHWINRTRPRPNGGGTGDHQEWGAGNSTRGARWSTARLVGRVADVGATNI